MAIFQGNSITEFDFEWLGVGRVEGTVISRGQAFKFHVVDFTNGSAYLNSSGGWTTIDANFTGVYMSSPNQPLRWEMRQTGAGSGSATFICSAVSTEGSVNLIGSILSDNASNNDIQLSSSWYNLRGVWNTFKNNAFRRGY